MMKEQFDLSGKIAIVTGCDTGLGQGMAVGLAKAGCDIAGVNIVEPSDTKDMIEGLGRKFLDIRANLMKMDDIPDIVAKTVAEYGRIDILVNNAGIIRREDAIEFTEKDWDDVMNINIKSVFFLSQAVAKQFVAQGEGGNIVNVASMLSLPGRYPRAFLYGIQIRCYGRHPSAGQRMGQVRHQCECHRSGLHGHQ